MESADVEIVNRDLAPMTLDSDDVTIDMEEVERGVGYLASSEREALPIGVIAVDAIFTRVRRSTTGSRAPVSARSPTSTSSP